MTEITRVPLQPIAKGALTKLWIGVAAGPGKVAALRGALVGRIINGLVTDEATATALLD